MMERAEVQGLLSRVTPTGNKWQLLMPGAEPRIFPKRGAVEELLGSDPELRLALERLLIARALANKEAD